METNETSPMQTPTGQPTYSKGDVVTLRKESKVYSTNPSKKEYTLNRRQKVTVHSFYPEYGGGYHPYRPAEVHWAGAGGYWCWTDAANVILEN